MDLRHATAPLLGEATNPVDATIADAVGGGGRGEVGGTSPRPTDEPITPPERSWTAGCTRIAGLGRLDQIQLLQDGYSVVQPDLLDDQAVDDLEN